MITNAVRCVPPANKPTPSEITHCRQFLEGASPPCKAPRYLGAGRIAHESTLDASRWKPTDYPFAHGARVELATGQVLFDSYHSRARTRIPGA